MMMRAPAKNSAVIVRLDRTIQYAAAVVGTAGAGGLLDTRFGGHDEQ